jgi:hypothetical protein
MAGMGKYLSLYLVVILAVSILLMIKPAEAQTIPKPISPYFTLKFVDKSHDVPSTTVSTIDPYTNKTTATTIPSYHVKDPEIEITITNQHHPLTINGNKTSVYYGIQTKQNYANWSSQPGYGTTQYGLIPQSDEQYTIIYLPAFSYPPESKVDVRIETVLSYQYSNDDYILSEVPNIMPVPKSMFISQSSGWSNTQTIEIPAIPLSPSTSVLEFPIVGLLALVVISITFLIVKRKCTRNTNLTLIH